MTREAGQVYVGLHLRSPIAVIKKFFPHFLSTQATVLSNSLQLEVNTAFPLCK